SRDAPTTSRTASSATSPIGSAMTFTASVDRPSGGGSLPTGSVTFEDFGVIGLTASTLGTAPLVNGVARLTTSDLVSGAHRVTATYSGDDTFGASASSSVLHLVAADL